MDSSFDRDRDGVVSSKDLAAILGAHGIILTDDDAENLLLNLSMQEHIPLKTSLRSGFSGLNSEDLERFYKQNKTNEICLRGIEWATNITCDEKSDMCNINSVKKAAESLNLSLNSCDVEIMIRTFGKILMVPSCWEKAKRKGKTIDHPYSSVWDRVILEPPSISKKDIFQLFKHSL